MHLAKEILQLLEFYFALMQNFETEDLLKILLNNLIIFLVIIGNNKVYDRYVWD